MKVTLTHLGVVAFGRLLAIWSSVLGFVFLIIGTVIILLLTLLGVSMSKTPIQVFGGGLIGIIIFFIAGMVCLAINSVIAFVIGAIAALVYNVVLKIGGGIDIDFTERKS
ncbi:hypothetical protein KKF81_00960 [Candidatus Micrarchaeota archaeon]|nr:hypothetical protein [Candidatus Micrarchaeota archaeon]MBU1165489.1 hypothetical protein [Candidatus Micrarchaeota archaeon]MBU1886327.1 hypothetical protein [Candidatus Micrarchaeota archaeon]